MNKAIENRRASAKLASSQRMAQNSAPLWRNAPTSADYTSLQQRSGIPHSLSSSAQLAESMAFHRSLRNYPAPPGFKPQLFPTQTKPDKHFTTQQQQFINKNSSISSRMHTSPSMDSLTKPGGKSTERCHITNLDSEQTNTPFYLDYLDSGHGNSSSPMPAFDHRSFMEMFRPPPVTATPLDSSQQQSSLPYSVNEFKDSLQSTGVKVPGTKLKQSSSFTNSFMRNSKMSQDGKTLAFGRTKKREIDLNAPLKTFASPARPVSEIITSNINFSQIDGNTVAQRPQTSYGSQSVQGDATYNNHMQNGRNYRHSIAEVIGGPSNHHYQPRIARRHDPELMPAQIKYTFREYASPSAYRNQTQPGSMTTSQSNFLMTTSSAGVSLQRSFAGQNRGMPKKSVSMSRIDLLAQPRRRIVARPAAPPTPTEPTNPGHGRQSQQTIRNAQLSASALLRRKPDIPTKRPQTAAASPATPSASASNRTTRHDNVPARSTVPSQKPRPKSQIEPLESLANNQQSQPGNEPSADDENREAKPSEDYKKLMAERRAAFQKQKLEKERLAREEEEKRKAEEEEKKRLEEEEKKKAQEEEEARRQQESQNEQIKALEEAELKRIESEKQAKELSNNESDLSSNENPSENAFVRNLEDSKQDDEMLRKTSEITREGEMFLVTGEVPKPVDPLVNVSMTQSFDASLLSSERAKSERLAKEKLEEHQAALLKQEELERQKRKSRVAELLKGRTRKNGDGNESPSGSGPSTPAQKTDNEAATISAEQSSDAEQLAQKLNGIVVAESESNQHQSNGTNGDTGVTNGELNGHQQDVIKQFVSENEQSLPPTNGF